MIRNNDSVIEDFLILIPLVGMAVFLFLTASIEFDGNVIKSRSGLTSTIFSGENDETFAMNYRIIPFVFHGKTRLYRLVPKANSRLKSPLKEKQKLKIQNPFFCCCLFFNDVLFSYSFLYLNAKAD